MIKVVGYIVVFAALVYTSYALFKKFGGNASALNQQAGDNLAKTNAVNKFAGKYPVQYSDATFNSNLQVA